MLFLLAFNSFAGLRFAIEKLEGLALNLGWRAEMRTQLNTDKSTICPLEFKTGYGITLLFFQRRALGTHIEMII